MSLTGNELNSITLIPFLSPTFHLKILYPPLNRVPVPSELHTVAHSDIGLCFDAHIENELNPLVQDIPGQPVGRNATSKRSARLGQFFEHRGLLPFQI